MVLITFIEPDGNRREVHAEVGDTVMTVATGNLVAGVVGECGGGLSCATCHVFVDDEWRDVLEPPEADETQMLDATVTPATEASRLSCQLIVRPELDGLVLRVADSRE